MGSGQQQFVKRSGQRKTTQTSQTRFNSARTYGMRISRKTRRKKDATCCMRVGVCVCLCERESLAM